ncbi:MAG: phosphoglycerate dehydrogenase, partial [Candidatus Binatia bacterium]
MSEPHKVLITDSLAPQGLSVFERYPDVAAEYRPGLPPDEIRRAIADYDALVVRSGTRVTADIIESGARLKVIGRAG